jgi:hypothetical protein
MRQILLSSKRAIVRDSFDRANNASSLGNADTGQAWVNVLTPVWGISGNMAYVSSGSSIVAIAVINAAKSKLIISMDALWKTGDQAAIVFRCDGTYDNVFRWLISELGTKLLLVKKVGGGSTTVLADIPFSPVNNTVYNLKVVTNGNQIRCYVDNLEKLSTVDTNLVSNTYCGMQTYNYDRVPTSTFDNFKVEAI